MWGIIIGMKDLALSVEEIIGHLRSVWVYVTHEERKELAGLLGLKLELGMSNDHADDSPVEIIEEVKEQLKMVRHIRKSIMSMGDKANPKELQSLVSTSSTLFATLTKYSNDIENQEKVKKIESATLEALKLLESEVQEVFFDALTKYLSA